jgi:hypothetical protein
MQRFIAIAALLAIEASAMPAQLFTAGSPQAVRELDRGGTGPPTMNCSVGQRYFQTDAAAGYNDWSCTGTNVWTQGARPTPAYGEMYFYTASGGSPTSITIDVTNQYHGVHLAATGISVNGWTYKTGSQAVISAVSDNGGGTILVTTATPHGLAAGDYVCQTGFTTRTTYRGIYKVLTTPLTTTYTVTRAFETSTDTGDMQRAWSLRANTGSAGTYRVSFTMSAQAASGTTDFRFELDQNTAAIDSIAGQTLFSTASRPQEMVGIGLVTIADDDVIFMTVKNLTDASDFSVWLANLSLNRI